MSFQKNKLTVAVTVAIAAAGAAPLTASATNGMNIEGYGPIATGMGGASMAYDNGTAAMMNNPATLGLMSAGNRLDLALGFLGPNVTSKAPGYPDAKSSGDAYYMPAGGWVQKNGQLTYGFGIYAQGGMGTEYDGNSFMAAGSGENVRSEVSVGRAILPLAFNVNDQMTVGGSLDFVWAGMDLKMAMGQSQFMDLVSTQQYGTASGSMVSTLQGAMGGGAISSVNWARFDFSNSNDFTGEATGYGVAGKLGFVYKVNKQLSLGATYHSTTNLGDLETDHAKVTMNVTGGGVPGGTATVPVTGKISVRDFQWPQTFGMGAAFQATDRLLLAADYMWINWKDVMKDFKMSFTADATQADPVAQGFGLNGQSMDAKLYQNWDNQNVFRFGASYKVTNAFTLRGGVSVANNPIPDKYENPLFPAIIKNHVMVGGGYDFSKASAVNASFTYAPKVEVTNGQGVTTSHSQTSWQLMYSHRF